MTLYNIIQTQTNKYIPHYILPEPTIMYLYNNKPINKSIQKVNLNKEIFLTTLTSNNIDNNIYNNIYNKDNCEILYIRVRHTVTNSSSEWKKIIQKN
jgi:hypothetical protein